MSSIRWAISTRERMRVWSVVHDRPHSDLIHDALSRIATDPASALRDARGYTVKITGPTCHLPLTAEDRVTWGAAAAALEEFVGTRVPVGSVVRALVQRTLATDPALTRPDTTPAPSTEHVEV